MNSLFEFLYKENIENSPPLESNTVNQKPSIAETRIRKIAGEELPLVLEQGELTGENFKEIHSGIFAGRSIRTIAVQKAIKDPNCRDPKGDQQELLVIRDKQAEETYDPSSGISTKGYTLTLDVKSGIYKLNGEICNDKILENARKIFNMFIERKPLNFQGSGLTKEEYKNSKFQEIENARRQREEEKLAKHIEAVLSDETFTNDIGGEDATKRGVATERGVATKEDMILDDSKY